VASSIGLAYHNLSTMLEAGVPMVRSITTISSGLDTTVKRAFVEVADGVSMGNTLAETMARNPHVFNPLDVMVIKAAETSGSLPESLALLGKWHEFQQRIFKRILSGCMLPIFLIHATAMLAPMPMLFLGGWNSDAYLSSVLGILLLFYIPTTVIFVIVRFTPKRGPLRTLLDRITLKIPVLGKAMYRLSISRFCWVFHMLCKAAVPATSAAQISVDSMGNARVAKLFAGGADSVKAGNMISDGFSSKLPGEFLDIWRVGEETGKLDDMTRKLAEINGENADFLFTEFAVWMPRVVYALVACVIIYCILAGAGTLAGAINSMSQ